MLICSIVCDQLFFKNTMLWAIAWTDSWFPLMDTFHFSSLSIWKIWTKRLIIRRRDFLDCVICWVILSRGNYFRCLNVMELWTILYVYCKPIVFEIIGYLDRMLSFVHIIWKLVHASMGLHANLTTHLLEKWWQWQHPFQEKVKNR